MLVIISHPAGLFSQVASACFLSGGLFADILIVRLALTLAYVFLLLHTLLGYPSWPGVTRAVATDGEPYVLALDAVLWAVLGVYVHGSSLAQLLRDERPVALSEREDELWRMFFRRARISRLLFKAHILPAGLFHTYASGDAITGPGIPPRVHIVVQGRAIGVGRLRDGGTKEIRMLSGDLFEFRHLHLFGVHVGFIERSLDVRAHSAVRTFSIPIERLRAMASGSAPMRQAWQAVIIASLAREAERGYASHEDADARITAAEVERWRDPSFAEMRADELPPGPTPGSGTCLAAPASNLLALMYRTFHLPWPLSSGFPGLRHAAVGAVQDPSAVQHTTKFVQLASVASTA
ncbi:hypothetical protein KFE25_007750 [Diacronema lutheri]|uniref:Uncharacterized protein n=2 Tax=Diacronema lutheri TaxID=2081491 RepID=A0A8J5XVJ6_DIALT|nr:hypothetical protein KFE25_007750 [Diacronema lutheri]